MSLDEAREPLTDEEKVDLRHRNWFLTINNPTKEDETSMKEVEPMCSYGIIAKEVGSECGTEHYHLTLVFQNAMRFSTIKQLFPRANIQKVRSMGHAIKYCEKDGDFAEFGKRPRCKGVKDPSPLAEVAKLVQAGANKRKIAQLYPVEMIRYHRGIDVLISLQDDGLEDRRWMGPYRWPQIEDWSYSWVIIGESGINKSQFAKSHFEPGRVLVCSNIDDLKRFNKEVHDGIIFDDMDFRHYPRTAQIHLVDQDENRTIHNRFEDTMIPAGTKKIFTCNQFCFHSDDPAINRRIKRLNLE